MDRLKLTSILTHFTDGKTGLKRSSEFPNITELILIVGGQKVGVESLDLKTQGCSAAKSTSFVLYHEAHTMR